MMTSIFRRERGSVLVEFALVALVLYLIFAAVLDFGRLMFDAQVVQSAAVVGARELALTPLPADATFTFDDALADADVRARIYDPQHLIVDLDVVTNLDAHFANLPVLNQMLRPLMIGGEIEIDGTPRNLLRYPGAILRNATTNDLFVAIPRVIDRTAAGETIDWLPVVEEIRSNPADATTGPFLLGTNPGGLVALRVNFPFQASALSAFRPAAGGPFESNLDQVIQVGSVSSATSLPGALVVTGDAGPGAYAGPFGLGRQFALTSTVRPFRRVLSGQMIMRRETYR